MSNTAYKMTEWLTCKGM